LSGPRPCGFTARSAGYRSAGRRGAGVTVQVVETVVHSMSCFFSKTSYERCGFSMGCGAAIASEHYLSLTTVTGEGNRTFIVVSNCCTPASKLVGGRGNVCVLISRTRSVVLSPATGLRQTLQRLRCHGHHPADAEPIGDHAETRRPERLSEGHLHLSPL